MKKELKFKLYELASMCLVKVYLYDLIAESIYSGRLKSLFAKLSYEEMNQLMTIRFAIKHLTDKIKKREVKLHVPEMSWHEITNALTLQNNQLVLNSVISLESNTIKLYEEAFCICEPQTHLAILLGNQLNKAQLIVNDIIKIKGNYDPDHRFDMI
ncbi:hypothetical protein [Arcticibacter eurypsychrophilus]|uniref:hypothetical protein n=1 Tax=Arcticibacter eurypsychrophilus TaxID=1434752 RepID=UPI00084DA0A6|nr:hypothetical protein [Arcticibacter eurypsychrophilus]